MNVQAGDRVAKDPSALAHAIRRARGEERVRNAHVLSGVRAGGAALLAGGFAVAQMAGGARWAGADYVAAAWSLVALAILLAGLRWREVAKRSGLAFPFVDVPAVMAIQMAVLPAMPDQARFIAMATTPLALLIIGSTFWLEPWLAWLTASVAAAGQAALLANHGSGAPAIVVTVAVLYATAAMTTFAASRIRALNESSTRYVTDLHLVETAFRDLLNHSPDGIVVHRGGAILYANAQLAAMLRAPTPQALRERRIEDLFIADDRESFGARVASVAQDGVASAPVEFGVVRSDGEVAPAEVRDVGVQFGDAPAILTVVRDLTGIHQMQQRLILSDRMASMGTLAAGVAHEINNPLTAIVGHLDLLAAELGGRGTGDADAVRSALVEALPDMRDAATRVRDIVRDLNVFSRAREVRTEIVDLQKVVDSSLRLAANELRHRARVERRYDPVPLVRASEARLGQLFLNLAVNAAQAIPEGDAAGNLVTVATRTGADGRAVVEVTDTGSGMSPELQQRIFDPFFTTKPGGFGTGLGLAICQRIATEAGGEIAVESVVGRGSTFRVVLPAAGPDEAAAVSTPAAAASLPRPASVLVVDDEPSVVRMLERMLTPPHRVTGFTDAADALARLRAGERFDVILCDVMMPRVTGMDFHAEVRVLSAAQASRIIFLTGGAFTERAQAFLREVPNLRLDKPFSVEAVRTLVAHTVG